MRKYLTLLTFSFLLLAQHSAAQNIAINDNGALPDTSAMLDVSSTTRGFLTPRLTATQMNGIVLPANGLLVYNTTANAFFVNSGSAAVPNWVQLSTGPGGISSINGLTGGTQTFALGTAGNDVAWSSAGTTHTLNLPSASATARGLVTTGTQTFGGAKTFSGSVSMTSLGSGAGTDSIVTQNAATGLLRRRTVNDVVAGTMWAVGGNSVINSGNQFLGTTTLTSVRIRTNNIERMVIDSNGKIGIGILNPQKPLEISYNLPGQGGIMQFRNTAANGWSSFDFIDNNGVQQGNVGFGNSGASAFANNFYFATNTTNSMIFATNSTERMRLAGSTGYLGLNNNNPNSTLSVGGSMSLAVRTINNTASVAATDNVIINTGSTNFTLTLPAANTCTGRIYRIVNHGTSSITISPAVTIASGATANTISNSAGSNVWQVISDGSNWRRISD